MSKQPLTEKQERVYQFLVKCSGDGLPPTVREICAATGIKSTSSVHGILPNCIREHESVCHLRQWLFESLPAW